MNEVLTPEVAALIGGFISIFTVQALVELGIRYARWAVMDS